MANTENLTPFTSKNQPANRGRKKGIPNIATVIKKYVETKIDTINPLTGQSEKLTVLDAIALSVIAHSQQANK
jgi:hypothetical protein